MTEIEIKIENSDLRYLIIYFEFDVVKNGQRALILQYK